MANIIVNSVTLKSKAEELNGYNSQLKTKIEELSEQESSLNSMWDGDANDAFHSAFQSDVTQMNNFYNAIAQYVSKFQEIAANYDKYEAENLQIASERNY